MLVVHLTQVTGGKPGEPVEMGNAPPHTPPPHAHRHIGIVWINLGPSGVDWDRRTPAMPLLVSQITEIRSYQEDTTTGHSMALLPTPHHTILEVQGEVGEGVV